MQRINQTGKRVLVPAVALLAILTTGEISGRSRAASQEKEVKNPFAGDPGAIEQGRSLFRLACALCHGIDARGGRGSDLTSGRWVRGDSDGAIFRTITKGVPGTQMPPGDFRDDEVWMIVAFLRSLSVGSGVPIAGSRESGERIFFGTGLCSQCHMVNGRGGRLGPDLSRIGGYAARFLAESIRDPNKEIARGYETVTAVLKDGKRINGARKNEDSFSLQLMDQQEELHLLLKRDLKETIYEKKSLMPEYNERNLKEQDLQDLIAYLDSLRVK